MDRKTLTEISVESRLKGRIATLIVTDRHEERQISTMLGVESRETETELMICKISIGLLGRNLTRHEEQIVRNEMRKLYAEYDWLQNGRTDSPVGEE